MLVGDETLAAIETRLLDAAVDGERWPEAIAAVVQATGSKGAVVLPIRGTVPGVPMSESLGELHESYFRDGWVAKDKRMNGVPKFIKTGVLVDQDVTTPDEMRHDPYYVDFLGRLGFRWFGGVMVKAEDDIWGLALQRDDRQGMFTPNEQMSLARLVGPFSRAATLARRLGKARFTGVADALDAVKMPSLLVDRTGDVIRINERARGVLGEDLMVSRRQLVARRDPATSRRLRSYIEAAIWADVRPLFSDLRPMPVPRAGRLPLLVEVQPLRGIGLDYFAAARAVVHIRDIEMSHSLAAGTLEDMFGMTDAETRLAKALFVAPRLIDAARATGSVYETAKSHLRSIFRKTGTNSQAELVLLLSRLSEHS